MKIIKIIFISLISFTSIQSQKAQAQPNDAHSASMRTTDERNDLSHSINDALNSLSSEKYQYSKFDLEYEFPPKQWFHFDHVDSDHIGYWLPSYNDRNMFRRLTKSSESRKIIDPGTRSQLIYKNLFRQPLDPLRTNNRHS